MTKPSLDLLRSLTDEHVLRALMAERQLTRAELAARTGISKPTVSESARRLSAAGLIRDTGARTSGRGRVGSYYGLAEDIGTALVVSIAPDGVVAECLDSHGAVLARVRQPLARPARPQQVEGALRAVAGQVLAAAPATAPCAWAWSVPPTQSIAVAAGWFTCRMPRSLSASCRRPTCSARPSTARSWSTTT